MKPRDQGYKKYAYTHSAGKKSYNMDCPDVFSSGKPRIICNGNKDYKNADDHASHEAGRTSHISIV